MSQMSDYLEGQIRAHLFRTATFTKPTTLGIALHTADPTDAASGAEVSGGSYARVARNPLDANWTTITNGAQNAAAITFPTPSGAWGTVTHFSVWDNTSAGNMLMYGPLTASKVIGATDPAPSFAINALQFTFTLGSTYLNNAIRDHIFRTASFTKPTTLGVALHTADPTDAGSGAEVSGGAYARVARAPLDANWTAASSTNGLTDNAAVITFPSPSANWGLITHAAVWDALTTGNLIGRGALTASKNVNNGDAAPSFPTGTLSLTYA
jgi:hypothetical protein